MKAGTHKVPKWIQSLYLYTWGDSNQNKEVASLGMEHDIGGCHSEWKKDTLEGLEGGNMGKYSNSISIKNIFLKRRLLTILS